MAINNFSIVGNLTKDATPKMAGETPVLEFSVAVNGRVWSSKSESYEDRADFFDCVIYGARAKALKKHMVSGSKVAISGKLKQDRWEKDGQKRSKVTLVVDELEFAGGKRSEDTAEDAPF